MKRIVFFIASLRLGGSEKACVRMANALAGKYDVTVSTIWGKTPLEKELDPRIHYRSRFPFYIRGMGSFASKLPVAKAHALFIPGEYDLEIAVGDGLESRVVSGGTNPNRFSWCHINLGVYGVHRSSNSLEVFSRYRKIICVSEANRRCFHDEMGFADKTCVAYSPVDAEKIISMAQEEVSLPENTIVAIGRLEPVKGFERLIEAVEKLECNLLIIGDGTRRAALEHFIRENRLQDRVRIAGFLDNPFPYLKQAKVLICSSYEESFGFTCVEAMLLRVPVIATRCGGVEEIIRSPQEGLLVENSTEGLRDGIARFLEGKAQIDVEAAYQSALRFSIENCVKEFEKILELSID